MAYDQPRSSMQATIRIESRKMVECSQESGVFEQPVWSYKVGCLKVEVTPGIKSVVSMEALNKIWSPCIEGPQKLKSTVSEAQSGNRFHCKQDPACLKNSPMCRKLELEKQWKHMTPGIKHENWKYSVHFICIYICLHVYVYIYTYNYIYCIYTYSILKWVSHHWMSI